MVSCPATRAHACTAAAGWLAAAPPTTVVALIKPEQLAVSYAAIVLVSCLGLVLLAAVIAGARHVRRLNRRPLPPSEMASDRWYEKPLVDPQADLPRDETSDVE